jgi:hypothetical protein
MNSHKQERCDQTPRRSPLRHVVRAIQATGLDLVWAAFSWLSSSTISLRVNAAVSSSDGNGFERGVVALPRGMD